MPQLLIAGGSGLVGSRLQELALEAGYTVIILTRNNKLASQKGYAYWNPAKQELDDSVITNTEFLVNLSGANIAEKAWTEKRKNELVDSRIGSTEFLVQQFTSQSQKLKAVVNASAVGFYKSSENRVMTENEEAAEGFMGELCANWEKKAAAFQQNNIRTVILRIGLVLSLNGGVLKAMGLPAKMGIGSYIGSGKQKMPWVHIDDLCQLILFAIENEKMQGIYNTTVPDAPTNKIFTKVLVKSFSKIQMILPTPSFLIKTILGERASILLNSYNPSSKKLLSTGFQFKYSDLEQAIRSLK